MIARYDDLDPCVAGLALEGLVARDHPVEPFVQDDQSLDLREVPMISQERREVVGACGRRRHQGDERERGDQESFRHRTSPRAAVVRAGTDGPGRTIQVLDSPTT
jgi:hypothetical protein